MTYHVKDLEAGPLLDQAVLRALGAEHVQECRWVLRREP